jgi:predicted ribosomally synthesized peptide with SipW-like signal peptide
MSLSRWTVATIGLGAVGLALVGVGAGATFTDSTTSTQTITAGSLDVSLSSPDVPGCTDATNRCHSLTLPPVGPVASTFLTNNSLITITNTGNIPVTFDAIQMSETHDGNSAASNALAHQMNVCIRSTDASGGPWTEGNGPLSTAVALTPSVKENPVVLAPNETATYDTNFYAGENSLCHSVSSDGTNTKAAWDGYDGGPYHTPASLTNAAMGGSVTPTLTFSFTG